jgi:hypothetical protein
MNKIKRQRIETFEYLNPRLEYNAASGQLFWKVLFPGKGAGSRLKYGAIKLALERLDFKAHRLCWILHYKQKPADGLVIDHINGDPSDNRICNLRACTQKENSRNSVTPKNSTTNFKGVSKQGSKYRAYVSVNRRQIHLGRFDTAEEAYAAYVTAARQHFGEYFTHG